jgi:capsular polysaccharide transport system permease protein
VSAAGAVPSLSEVAARLRDDDDAGARALLLRRLQTDAAQPGFGDFAAATWLGESAVAMPAVDAMELRPLLRAPDQADLPRLTEAILGIASAPTEAGPRIEAACLLLHAGEPWWAEQALLPTWQRDPGALACRVISGVWAVLGRWHLALDAAAKAAEADPGVAEYHRHHAGILLHQREPAAAVLAAGRAIGLAPGDAIAWREASAAFLALGHTAEAIQASRRAAALSQEQAVFAEEILVSAGAEALRPHERTGPPAATRRDTPPPPGQGWPDWARVPEALPPPPRIGVPAALRARVRLINALMLREARTFFTHSRLGYAWALFEPLTHVFVLMVAISFLGGMNLPIIGDSMAVFYMTGVLPYLFFCHLTERGLDLARSQKVVLSLPSVTLGDVLVSSLVLRAATDSVVFVVSVAVFLALGMGVLPDDIAALAHAYVLLFLFGSGIAALNMALSTLHTLPEKLWPIVLRALYFLSGIFYHPDAMPAGLREWVLWNPLVHVIEWVREAYFPLYISPWLDEGYVARCAIAAMLLGALAAAAASRRARLMH